MNSHMLKLALCALALAALGFAGYRCMQRRDRVEIQSDTTQQMKYQAALDYNMYKQK